MTTEIQTWWPQLPQSVRDEIRRDPSAPLNAQAVVAITHARGVGPAGTAWGSDAAEYTLTVREVEWIESHADA